MAKSPSLINFAAKNHHRTMYNPYKCGFNPQSFPFFVTNLVYWNLKNEPWIFRILKFIPSQMGSIAMGVPPIGAGLVQGKSHEFHGWSMGYPYDSGNPQISRMTIPGWWARATPLKNMSSSIGMIMETQYIGKIKLMFQTTNQIPLLI